MSAIQQVAVTQITTPGNSNYDPYYSNVSLLLSMNGSNGSTSFVDASPNQKNVTANGNTQLSTTQSKFGGSSVYFDGTGDILSITGSQDFVLTNDFTIEGWVYIDSTMVSSRPDNLKIFIFVGWNTGNTPQFYVVGTTTTAGTGIGFYDGTNDFQVAVTVPKDQWVHLAFIRTGSSIYGFVNGTRYTISGSYSATIGTTATVVIAGNPNQSANYYSYLKGYIDDLRITNGVARYTSNFTVPAYANPLTGPNYDPFYDNVSLLLHCNGTNASTNFIDNSGSPKTVTANGNAQISTTQWKFNGSSAYFDGTGDYLTCTSNPDLLLTGDFTIELWVNPSVGGGYTLVFLGTEGSGRYFWFVEASIIKSNLYGSPSIPTYGSISMNAWTHLAFVRSGSTIRVYINGVASGTTDTQAGTLGNTGLVSIGGSSGTGSLNGYIDDFRITKGVARYTSNFTPPRVPFADSNINIDPYYDQTVLLLPMNGANASTSFIDSSKTAKAITPNGNTQLSTTQSKFGGSSVYFDGTGDGLSISSSSDFGFETGDFTIEWWAYLTANSVAGGTTFFDFRTSVTGIPWTIYLKNTGGGNFIGAYTSFGATGVEAQSGLLALNTWYHIVIQRTGSSWAIYLNGISQTLTGSSYNGNLGSSNQVRVGIAADLSSSPFTGYIDDVRITKGVARYTANFTVPVRPNPTTGVQYDNYYDNVSLLLHANGSNNGTSFIDSSLRAKTITATNAVTSTTQYKYGVSSAYFDGTADNLLINYNTDFYLDADFTIELWFYANAYNGAMILNFAGGLNIAYASYELVNNSDGINFAASSTNTGYDIGSETGATGRIGTITLNTWNHLAVVRSGNVYIGFVNGVKGYAQVLALTPYNPNARGLAIGGNYANTWGGTPVSTVNGYIDDLRITKGVARYGTNGDPFYSNVSLLLHMDGSNASTTFTDTSPTPKTVTVNGNAQISTAQWRFGGSSAYFDGNGDYLSIANDASINLSSGNFTIECWVYSTSNNGNILNKDGQNNVSYPSYAIGISLGFLSFSVGTGNGVGGVQSLTSSISFPLNTWVYVTGVKNGTTLLLYQNGVNVAFATQTVSIVDGSKALFIGYERDQPVAAYLTGYIDDFRITKGVARYTPSNGDPFYANVSLLLHMNGSNGSTTFTDNSIVPKTVTVGGNTQISTAQSVFGGGSALFDGTGDYLQLSSSSSLIMGTGDLTMEAWIYMLTTASFSVVGTLSYNAGASFRISPTVMVLDSSGINSVSRSATINLNTWYHVAVTRQSGTVRFFLNGVQQGADQTYTQNFSGETRTVGGEVSANTLYLNGYMDDVRITKGVARYTSNFTPPTQPFPDNGPSFTTPSLPFFDNGVNFTPPTQAFPDQGPQTDPFYYNTSLLLHFDGTNASTNFVDNSPVIKSVTPSGNAQISTAQSKFGGSSAYFDGTGDLLFVPASNDFNFGTNPWTIECWVRIVADASGVIDIIIGNRASNFLSGQWYLFYVSSNIVFDFRVGGSDNNTVGATGISLNTWYHIAVVRNGTNFAMYKDGVLAQASTINISNSIGSTLYNISIGNSTDSSFPLNGYIDDLRITKGVARYLNNFTPPQRPFPNQ